MSRLVANLVSSARDYHPAFDQKRNPPGPLYRYLARYVSELQGQIMAICPEAGVVEETMAFDFPLPDFAAGVAIGDVRLVTDVVVLDDADPASPTPLPIISRSARFNRNTPRRFCWPENGILYLSGVEADWSRFTQLQVQVVASMTDADEAALQVANATMPLPDAAAPTVIEHLALFMARRGHNDAALPPISLSAFAGAADLAEQKFFNGIAQRNVGSFTTADVYP